MNASVQSKGSVLDHARWRAFCTVCLGFLLIVIDGSVVNVALPSIKAELGFSQPALIWVSNAYAITYSGFLLVGGRLADFFGHRRLFLFGISVFTVASFVCGVATSGAILIGARAVQGLGGAVIAPVVLSLIGNLFSEESERAQAMSILNFVGASGAALGYLLGGTLTTLINWHWIFLVNLPVGAAVYVLALVLVRDSPRPRAMGGLDIGGAATVTGSLLLTVYGIMNASKAGWLQTATFFLGAIALLILFLYIETRVPRPIIPLSLLRRRNVAASCVMHLLWTFCIFGCYFTFALYLQAILEYSAEQTGWAFLPSELMGGALSLGISAKLITRFGTVRPLSIGFLIASAGMLTYARAPLHGNVATDIFPGMFLLGLGIGTMGSSMFLIGMKDTPPEESGLISGILISSAWMGGALGIATLVSAGSAYTNKLLAAGISPPVALNSGYHLIFFVGAALLASLPLISAALLPVDKEGARPA